MIQKREGCKAFFSLTSSGSAVLIPRWVLKSSFRSLARELLLETNLHTVIFLIAFALTVCFRMFQTRSGWGGGPLLHLHVKDINGDSDTSLPILLNMTTFPLKEEEGEEEEVCLPDCQLSLCGGENPI